MINHLVSVIIPYFKKRRFIIQTINSVKKQTYKNLEVVLIYDEKNKKDLKFLKNLLKGIKNQIILNKKNYGVSYSRNIGIKNCKGSFIAFLDADDLWKPKKIKTQIAMMLNKNYDLSYTSYNLVNEKNKFLRKRNVSDFIDYNKLLYNNEIGLSTVVIKKKISKIAIFPNLKTQEDFCLWLKLLKKGVKFLPIKETLTSWRKTPNSLSSNIFQKLKNNFELYYYYENRNFINSIYGVVMVAFNKIRNNLWQK